MVEGWITEIDALPTFVSTSTPSYTCSQSRLTPRAILGRTFRRRAHSFDCRIVQVTLAVYRRPDCRYPRPNIGPARESFGWSVFHQLHAASVRPGTS